MSKIHEEFCSRVEEISKKMSVKRGIKSPRKGVGRVRDYLIFFKNAFAQAESWAGLPKAVVFWLSLTPIAIANFNELLKFTNFPLQVPLSYGSMIAIGLVIGLMAFGFLAWTHFGLRKGQSELGAKIEPTYTLFYEEFQEIKKRLDKIERGK